MAPKPRPLALRLFSKFTVGDGCWEWTAALYKGYGVIGKGGRGQGVAQAHRAVYEALVGPIPDGMQLDHLCRNRRCVRPSHLEPVTAAENKRRGMSPAAINARKTHCHRGHPLVGEHLGVQANGGRYCRTCRNALRRAAKASA